MTITGRDRTFRSGLDKMTKQSLRLSIVSLFIANLFPLIGVFFFGWSVSTILIIYWSENVIIGFFNIIKMALAKGKQKSKQTYPRFFLIGFFVVHFGIFTFGHAAFVFSFFGTDNPSFQTLLPALLPLFISHGVSMFLHFIQNEEYKRVSYDRLFFQPYKRVVVMHLTIIFGAWVATAFHSPPLVLVVLIIIKIAVDIIFHKKEHTDLAL
jgi:hypothetical protein